MEKSKKGKSTKKDDIDGTKKLETVRSDSHLEISIAH